MKDFPIRRLDLANPAEKAQHDQMVALVEKMLRLKREYADTPPVQIDQRAELDEQIQRTDRQIDALVYQLYGLTDAEIAIVEG